MLNFFIRTTLPALIASFVLLTGSHLAQARPQQTERAFQDWIKGPLWRKASARGISAKLYKRAFANIRLNWKLPDLKPPGRRRVPSGPTRQSEFRSPGYYFKQRQLNAMVKTGRGHLAKRARLLSRIEKRFGVPRGIIIAIWGKETAFGRAKIPYNAISILATQAFMGRRKQMFEQEVLAALTILQQGHISVRRMKSSWAGALGHPQFMPSSFLKYAVDFNNDGRKDIWSSIPDALASIANYLQQNGWNSTRHWGFEARIPKSVSCILEGPDQGLSIKKWQANKIKRSNGRPFPRLEMNHAGFLLMPAGRFGPAFIVTDNFYVLKKYNESDVYALFIGHLADRFKNDRPFRSKWRKLHSFTRRAVYNMQVKLVRRGHDVGGVDGLIGYKTRTSVGVWQTRHKRPPTCYPDPVIFRQLN